MKKLILVVTITVLGILACKKNETHTPFVKKYEYKRTSGDSINIYCDLFVDTGSTIIKVTGKGFDPSKKNNYHLIAFGCKLDYPQVDGNAKVFMQLEYNVPIGSITDSTIIFKVQKSNILASRRGADGYQRCRINDSVGLWLIVTSIDSTQQPFVEKYNIIKAKNVKNKYFFHILSDTLIWPTRFSGRERDTTIAIQALDMDNVNIFFNDNLLIYPTWSTLSWDAPYIWDTHYIFESSFYSINKGLNMQDGFYKVTLFHKRTGEPIEERHGKKGLYVKFIK